MANLWYKIAENNDPAPIEGTANFYDTGEDIKPDHQHVDAYWDNLSPLRDTKDPVAHIIENYDGDKSIHCNKDRCKEGTLKINVGSKIVEPISFEKARKTAIKGLECFSCRGTIVPARPHSQKECQDQKQSINNGLSVKFNPHFYRSMHPDACDSTGLITPHGHKFIKSGKNPLEVVHHKDLWPGGHISDKSASAYGTSGDLEVLLGAEAEWRNKNGLYLFKGGEQ